MRFDRYGAVSKGLTSMQGGTWYGPRQSADFAMLVRRRTVPLALAVVYLRGGGNETGTDPSAAFLTCGRCWRSATPPGSAFDANSPRDEYGFRALCPPT